MSNTEISIEHLTIAQKIELMERLWADLAKRPDDIPEYDWHGDILAKRINAIESGEVEFVDWDDIKQRLLRRYE